MGVNSDTEYTVGCEETVDDQEKGTMPKQFRGPRDLSEEDEELGPFMKAVRADAVYILSSILLIILFTVCSACLPEYLKAVNQDGSVFGALVVISLVSWCILWILTGILLLVKQVGHSYVTSSLQQYGKYCGSWKSAAKIGTFLGVTGIIILYARDRNRVPCHLQEPLTVVLLPAAFCFSTKVFWRTETIHRVKRTLADFVFMIGTFYGLFLCVDSQMFDAAYCYGKDERAGAQEDQLWDTQTNAMWCIVYVIGIVMLAYFHVMLEKHLLQEMKLSDSSDDEEVAILIRTKKIYQKLGKSLVKAASIQHFSVLTVLALFWTDIFYSVGKAGSITKVGELMANTFTQHFHNVDVMKYGWPIILCYPLILVLLIYMLTNNRTEGVVVTELFAVPLSTFIWAFARGFLTETGFGVVGMIVLIATVAYYYTHNAAESSKRMKYDEI